MPEQRTKVNHHAYDTPGVTDRDVLIKQAALRRDRYGETSIVHAHSYEKPNHGLRSCNSRCMVFEPGYLTRSIATERVPVEDEEQY